MIRLAKPNIDEDAIARVGQILRTGNLVQGKCVSEFEAILSQYLGVEHVVVVSSATAALHLSLLALGIGEGDEVIVPAFSFPATANVVEVVGAKPIFIDISLNDFCMDVSKIENAITSSTRAIIPVHEFGHSADMQSIVRLSKQFRLDIIEDAACALGCEFKGRKVGSFGATGCFSFHPRKNITTGEGGAIITDEAKIAEKLRSLRNHGIVYSDKKIDFKYPGLNYRMTDFQAVLGTSQMDGYEAQIARRNELGLLYNEKLSNVTWVKTPSIRLDSKMVFQSYHILVGDNINRNDLIKYLQVNGIEANYGAQALHMQQYFRETYLLTKNQFPNSALAYENGLVLPMGAHINEEEVDNICNTVRAFGG